MLQTRETEPDRLLTDPVFVIGCNRSGTTILFKTLSAHPDLWTRHIENRDEFLRVFPDDGPDGALVRDATEEQRREVRRFLYEHAKNRELAVGVPVLEHLPLKLFQKSVSDLFKRPPIRMVDKTPSNCFRVDMLAEVFPDARFVYLVRRGEAVVSSLMEGWKRWDGEEPWQYDSWNYLRPPGWQDYTDRPLREICAFQFRTSNEQAISSLEKLDGDRWILARHEDLVTEPAAEYDRLRRFLDLAASNHWDDVVERLDDRVWTRGGSPPEGGKWCRLHGEEVKKVRPTLKPINDRFYTGNEHLDTT